MSAPGARSYKFDRSEWAGSLGDLGTLLPLAIGLVSLSGLQATAVFGLVGLYYIAAGLYFGTPFPVQPMKVISAVAIAGGLDATGVALSGLWMGGLLLLLGATRLVDQLRRLVPHSALRGIQLSLGAMLSIRGLELVLRPDPQLVAFAAGPLHTGLLLGLAAFVLGLVLLDSRRLPAALMLVGLGLVAGLALARGPLPAELALGPQAPELVPYGLGSLGQAVWVLPAAVLPQLPTTLGNAVLSQVDVSRELFPQGARRCTVRAVCLSMGLANLVAFALGGMPMCHGAGGSAAHHRFGARTAGANLIIGGLLLGLALLFGRDLVAVLGLLPDAVLGVLLCFAGLQLAMLIADLRERRDFFVALSMLAVSLATNLAVGFGVGVGLAWLLRSERLRV